MRAGRRETVFHPFCHLEIAAYCGLALCIKNMHTACDSRHAEGKSSKPFLLSSIALHKQLGLRIRFDCIIQLDHNAFF